MNIPFDQLYNYFDGLTNLDTIIYRFAPAGSKNLEDLSALRPPNLPWYKRTQTLTMVVHDQEPLNFDLYNQEYLTTHINAWFRKNLPDNEELLACTPYLKRLTSLNLAFVRWGTNTYDRSILVHSEQRSPQIGRYQTVGFVPVYWWSHAMIARDWYRYAKHDPLLTALPQSYNLDFNIYNRSWSGTREYRLKFADLVMQHKLESHCQLRFQPIDNNVHYLQHRYVNSKFAPITDLEQLPPNNTAATASADYSALDYNNCWFDIVLETLYDDPRLHLTEKALRPIACGKPFILVATAGSLNYLRRYGFKTFGDYIDESYDLEVDAIKRLDKIIKTMQDIAGLTPTNKLKLQQQLRQVADYNKQHFFSKEFSDQVVDEFLKNYQQARLVCEEMNKAQHLKWSRQQFTAEPSLSIRMTNGDNFDELLSNF